MVTVPEASQSGEEGVVLTVRGADDDGRRGHVTKHDLREPLHVSKREVLYAGDIRRDGKVKSTQRESIQNRKIEWWMPEG